MGIHDRKYMNNPGMAGGRFGQMPKSVTGIYVAICAVLYFLGQMVDFEILLFNQQELTKSFEFWRILTPAFFFSSGASIVMVVIELFVFYLIGKFLEGMLGSKRFINLLIACTLGSALFGLFVPACFSYGFIGGMLSAIFLAYGLILGSQKMTLMLFFVLPVTLSGHMLAGFSVGIIVIQCLFSQSYWLAGVSMLGACVGSYFFITQYQAGTNVDFLKIFKRGKKKGPAKKKAPKMNKHQKQFHIVEDEEPIEDVDAFIKENVDPILEKIAESGMSSLTAREKKILEKAKSKINKS
ncbi:MAG: rhomboid family intramembrane serine protease [Lentisphaeraceae bacterium]|nr:rhomboid family intramembrane serine protease [Lentisphaeraceae bacterium]